MIAGEKLEFDQGVRGKGETKHCRAEKGKHLKNYQKKLKEE